MSPSRRAGLPRRPSARPRARAYMCKKPPSCTIGCRLRARLEHSDMGKVKGKLRSRAKQSGGLEDQKNEVESELRSFGLVTFDQFTSEIHGSELGSLMASNFGIIDWEVDFVTPRFLSGSGKALLPVTCYGDGTVEYYHAREGTWKPSSKSLDAICRPISTSFMSNAPDLVGILKSVVAMQTPCWSDRLYPAHKFQETRSPFALDLLHCSGKISPLASEKETFKKSNAQTSGDYFHINSECFESVCAAQRVRDLFVEHVNSGSVRLALEAGDIVVTPHFSRFNILTHASEFSSGAVREDPRQQDDVAYPDIRKILSFLQSVGEFWGPFYNHDEDIKPVPVHWLNRLVEPNNDAGDVLDGIPYENNARRILMAAVATQGKLKWNVGPAGSVFANVSVWSGPNHVCTHARLTLCPIKFPPYEPDGCFGRHADVRMGQLPEKWREQMEPREYETFVDFWTKEWNWVYARPRLRVAFEFTRQSFDFGNAKEWTRKPPKVRSLGGGCHSTPPPPPPKPEPAEPDNSEWLNVLCKGVARELCDAICEAVLRRVRAPPRRSAAESFNPAER